MITLKIEYKRLNILKPIFFGGIPINKMRLLPFSLQVLLLLSFFNHAAFLGQGCWLFVCQAMESE